MSRTVIVVGLLPVLSKVLADVAPDLDVVFIESPELADRPAIVNAVALSPRRRSEAWPYPQSATADAWYHLHRELDVVAVVPAVEYAIVFAARLAERYGVPGAGLGAAQLLRDKSLLRTVTTAAGVRNPRFAQVESFAEVAEFARENAGPLVLKPSNRQASVGTQIVLDHAELEQAWAQVHELDEAAYVAFSHLPLRLQIEEYIDGVEFSVELLVRDGTVVFANVTEKLLYPGNRPVEFGHVVPARIDQASTDRLIEVTTELVAVVGYQNGVIHCEWIVRDGEPFLVECTGRLPGDGIVHLIERAWPVDLVRRYLAILLGRPVEAAPTAPMKASATLFPLVTPGVITAIDGMAEAAGMPGVYICLTSLKVGDRVNELRSSWDRAYGVATNAETAEQALAQAYAAVAKVRFTTVRGDDGP